MSEALLTAQVIDLGDNMDFGLLPEGATADVLECSDPSVPTDCSNLVIKVSSQPEHALQGCGTILLYY